VEDNRDLDDNIWRQTRQTKKVAAVSKPDHPKNDPKFWSDRIGAKVWRRTAPAISVYRGADQREAPRRDLQERNLMDDLRLGRAPAHAPGAGARRLDRHIGRGGRTTWVNNA
jgi:hypothetical protein